MSANADEEMDIDDTTAGTVPDESAYIGDNCLSTPVSHNFISSVTIHFVKQLIVIN